MKKELSFYEFVGILIPGCTTLFGINFIYGYATSKQLIDFEKFGETLVFLVISYAAGHFVQSIGSLLERIIWKIYGGKPTAWLLKSNRFNRKLFDEPLNQQIVDKVVKKWGPQKRDFGLMVYNYIWLSEKSTRIDIFSGNYGLFRGLSVTFLILATAGSFYLNWWQAILCFIPFGLTGARMMRYGVYYAREIYWTFYNMQQSD